jgi:hypothetical protein
MICIDATKIYDKAARMPLAYLEDCRSVATVRPEDNYWCFTADDYYRLRRKYRGYAVSESDAYQEGEAISGCCDRADQY